MGDDLNCRYGATTVGILKIVTVLIGLIVVILLYVGADQALHFAYIDSNDNRNGDTCGSDTDGPCPQRWMINVAKCFCLLGLIISAICLIIMLIIRIKHSVVHLLDHIYHLVFGLLILLSGIFALVYACIALDMNCNDNDDACNDSIENVFKPSFFLTAGIFAIINGIIYMIVCCMIRRTVNYN